MVSCPLPVRLTLSLTDELNDRLDQLAADLGGSKADVFRKAIALLEAAVSARRRGEQVAIVDDQSRVLTTITGLGSRSR